MHGTICWQDLQRILLQLVFPLLLVGSGVGRVDLTRRSLRFFGRLNDTRLGMACLSFLEACMMGRCCFYFYHSRQAGESGVLGGCEG